MILMFLIGLKRKFNNSNSIYKIYVLIGIWYSIWDKIFRKFFGGKCDVIKIIK